MERKGPGLLLRDILRDDDPQITAIAAVIAAVSPDILLLQDVDHDRDLHALRALRDRLARDGAHYPHILARRPNSGMHTGQDMDGNGRCCDARDAQGYGAFTGQGGMALLSRLPIDHDAVRISAISFGATCRARCCPRGTMARRSPLPGRRRCSGCLIPAIGWCR